MILFQLKFKFSKNKHKVLKIMNISSKRIQNINIYRNLIKKKFSNSKIYNISDRRIVVTGLGTVNPLGVNANESWENLKKLNTGIKSLENESYGKDLPNNCKIGAPIPKHFEAKKFKTLVFI